MNKEEFLKNLSYERITGRIEYWNVIKGFGKISTDKHKDIKFDKKDIINDNINIEKGMFVDFILDDCNTNNLKADKILIKQINLIYYEICEKSIKQDSQIIVIDSKQNKYIIEESNVKNFKYYQNSSKIMLEIFTNGFTFAKVLNKGLINTFNVAENQCWIRLFEKIEGSPDSYKFNRNDLNNTFEVSYNQIVWFEINGGFANNIYVSEKEYY